jgi:putative endonuclease
MEKVKGNTREIGSAAEQIARSYLISKGYRILAANWYCGHLELDIIAADKEELVIVEVKSRQGEPFSHPTEAVSAKKIRQVIEAAETYIQLNNWEKDTRFDLITVIFNGPAEFELEHYEDAFNAEA